MAQKRRTRVWYRVAEGAVLYVFWLIFTGNTSTNELWVGGAAAVLAATAAEAVLGLNFARFYPHARWLLEFWRVPGMVASGCWALLEVLVLRNILGRPVHGELKTIAFEPGGSDSRSAARRALAILFTTLAPNFIVVRIDRRQKLMLYHQVLGSSVPALTKKLGARP